MNVRTFRAASAGALCLLLIAGGVVVFRGTILAPNTFTAVFATAKAIYAGDQVRIAGVAVGKIEAIQPQGATTRMTLTVDRDVPVPADAKAIIVAPNLVSARYVQLAPAYRTDGPTMTDGAEIPVERTAVPVEWDEVKSQLTRLATELGPHDDSVDPPTSRLIESAADAMAGNGAKLRRTLTQLSSVGRIFADGSGNFVDIISNLQKFIGALRDSTTQIVQFQSRLATLTSVLDGSRSDLDGALTNVSEVVGDVQRFVRNSRNQTSEQVRQLASVTQNVVDHQKDLEQILHVAPTAIANTLNMFDPRDGGATGLFAFANMSNPVQFVCGAIGAIENATAPETARLCSEYLGPGLSKLNINYIPLPINPLLAPVPSPDDIIYTDPRLAPGGGGIDSGVPETSPAVSAYTGAGDVPPPPGYGPPQPPQAPHELSGMMLPSDAAPAQGGAPLAVPNAEVPNELDGSPPIIGPVEGTASP